MLVISFPAVVNHYRSRQLQIKKGSCIAVITQIRRYSGIMSSEQERAELDQKARQGETVVPGGTGGRSLEAQEHLAEGRSRGGQTRKEQIGTEGYKEMGRKGGLSTTDKSGKERAQEEGIPIDEPKFRTKS